MDKGQVIARGTAHELKQQTLQQKKLTVTSDAFAPDLISQLSKRGIHASLHQQKLDIQAQEIDFYEIINVLKAHHVNVKGIHMEEPSLEDVFIQLTKKEATT